MRALSLLCLSYCLLLGCDPGHPQTFKPTEPPTFQKMLYPSTNPTTAEGLALGRQLFFDPILSADSTVSCATCHVPGLAFSDGKRISTGVGGRTGRRNSPSLGNVGYLHESLFWDGRADKLEAQALHPVADPNEMGGSWPRVISKLRRHPHYPTAFRKAFGLSNSNELNPDHVGRALAQFQRSLITAEAKYDRIQRGEASYTRAEALGAAIFFDMGDEPTSPYFGRIPTGECAHCHTAPHFSNQRFFNNGLDEAPNPEDFTDPGRGAVSGSPYENGLFKTPSLRNVGLTAPYMHDGRFPDLESVIEHYSSGGHYAPNKSANVKPLLLSKLQKQALLAFLETLTDTSFVNKPAHQAPRPMTAH